jgi:hypothetical protein
MTITIRHPILRARIHAQQSKPVVSGSFWKGMFLALGIEMIVGAAILWGLS